MASSSVPSKGKTSWGAPPSKRFKGKPPIEEAEAVEAAEKALQRQERLYFALNKQGIPTDRDRRNQYQVTLNLLTPDKENDEEDDDSDDSDEEDDDDDSDDEEEEAKPLASGKPRQSSSSYPPPKNQP